MKYQIKNMCGTRVLVYEKSGAVYMAKSVAGLLAIIPQ